MDQWVKAIIKLSVRFTMGMLREAQLLQVHGRWQRSAHEAQYGVEQVKIIFLTQSPIHYGMKSDSKGSSSLVVVRLVNESYYLDLHDTH